MNAERLLAHYERIADAPDAIARLRRFILDLAVRGKLVPQDPNDEPASELLKRIAAEKARLVKAGEIRKPKPLRSTIEMRPPFDLPHELALDRAWRQSVDRSLRIAPDSAAEATSTDAGDRQSVVTAIDIDRSEGIRPRVDDQAER